MSRDKFRKVLTPVMWVRDIWHSDQTFYFNLPLKKMCPVWSWNLLSGDNETDAPANAQASLAEMEMVLAVNNDFLRQINECILELKYSIMLIAEIAVVWDSPSINLLTSASRMTMATGEARYSRYPSFFCWFLNWIEYLMISCNCFQSNQYILKRLGFH